MKPNGLVGLAMLAIGVVLLGWAGRTILTRSPSSSWPSAAGQAMTASVGERSSSGRPAFVPEVEYAFEVAGSRYLGDTIRPDGQLAPSADRAATLLVAQSYFEQPNLRVYYDPKDPRNNCLEPGAPVDWILIGAAVFLGLVSTLGGISLLRRSS